MFTMARFTEQVLELAGNLAPQITALVASEIRDGALVLGETMLQDMVSAIDEEALQALGPDHGELALPDLKLCVVLGLVGAVPSLETLAIEGLPATTSVEGGERALGVLFAALHLNHSLRELDFRGVFGTETACWHVGQMLRSVHCTLEALRLHNTGVESGGLRQICEALHCNSKLSLLDVSESPVEGEGVEHLAGMLRKNATLQYLHLRNIGLTGDGTRHLSDALSGGSEGLETLDLSYNEIGQDGVGHLAKMLAHNRSLVALKLSYNEVQGENGQLADGLSRNNSLKSLGLANNRLSRRGMELLFTTLATHRSLEVLDLRHVGEMPGPHKLAAMLATNRSLQQLHIAGADYPAADWAHVIIPGLAHNQQLQSIDLQDCPGIAGDEVFAALSRLLQTNNVLQQLQLFGTPLHDVGKAQAMKEELRLNKEFRAALSAVPKSKPKSCRIILCGFEYAGKTTLFQTLKRLEDKGTYYQQMKVVGQMFWQSRLSYWLASDDKEVRRRTRGIDIHCLRDEEELRISVWDFAGHREFHALQDSMFPTGNAATLFIFTFSPILSPIDDRAGQLKTQQHLMQEFSYWLKFIASNSKPSQPTKPSVIVVITNKDRVGAKMKSVEIWTKHTIWNLAGKFQDLVTVLEVFFVNALDEDDAQLRKLVDHSTKALRENLSGLREEPSICNCIGRALGGEQHSPIISIADFVELCKREVEFVTEPKSRVSLLAFMSSGDKWWKAIAAFLHDSGELMYYDGLNFIVRNPRWFGYGILGHLIDIFSEGSEKGHVLCRSFFKCCFREETHPRDYLPRNGLIHRITLLELLEKALESVGINGACDVNADDLIQLMLHLNLCYEETPGDPETGYLLPAIFYDEDDKAANGKRRLKWRRWTSAKCIFLARRLKCADSHRTFLTPGFFPRLQVVLRNQALDRKWVTVDNHDNCSLEKNLFCILVNGMEIQVEFSGSAGYFVDILVKSSKSQEETMEFVHPSILGTIRTFCAWHEGCQGVTLVEAVVRPGCVQDEPVLCAYRKHQSILVDWLKQQVANIPGYQHCWSEVRNESGEVILPFGKDDGKFLLEGEIVLSLEAALNTDDSEICYAGSHPGSKARRGVALIISMENGRPGGAVDRGRLETLAHSTSFEPQVLLNCSATKLRDSIKNIAEWSGLSEDDCFVCSVNAHGGTDDRGQYILDSDGEKIFLVSEILEPFKKSKPLAGKPKVFFINACRGPIMYTNTGFQQQAPLQTNGARSEVYCLEDVTDWLLVLSTTEDSISLREETKGTNFVIALVEAILRNRQTTDVLSIMNSVNYAVSSMKATLRDKNGRVKGRFSQSPVVQHTLRKRLYWRG